MDLKKNLKPFFGFLLVAILTFEGCGGRVYFPANKMGQEDPGEPSTPTQPNPNSNNPTEQPPALPEIPPGPVNLTLSWNAVTTDLDGNPFRLGGYRIHYGTESRSKTPNGKYAESQDVGKFTQAELKDLPTNVTLYIAVTAYDFAGDESDYSSEIMIRFPRSTRGNVRIDMGAPTSPVLSAPQLSQ